jgi:hypothetical protein
VIYRLLVLISDTAGRRRLCIGAQRQHGKHSLLSAYDLGHFRVQRADLRVNRVLNVQDVAEFSLAFVFQLLLFTDHYILILGFFKRLLFEYIL